jgi:hypothetical protein
MQLLGAMTLSNRDGGQPPFNHQIKKLEYHTNLNPFKRKEAGGNKKAGAQREGLR